MAMEIFNGIAMGTRSCFYSGSGTNPRHRVSVRGFNRVPYELNPLELEFCAKTLRRRVVGEFSAFNEKDHMEYYNSPTVPVSQKENKKKVGWHGVSEKKRAKLVKDLSKNLCLLSELGFGLESDPVKANAISEATLILQAHLKHLRAQGKKMKEGKMACSSAMDDSVLSSSSSESSDSECDNEVVAECSETVAAECSETVAAECSETVAAECRETLAAECHETAVSLEEPKAIEEVGVVGLSVYSLEGKCSSSMGTSVQLKRVEVCMGGKCKKMGAQVLMDEFQNMLGSQGTAVGCKCMGKCKTAPNVRVFNGSDDDSVRSPSSNPLYIGVGLEDVGVIVANYLGSHQRC